MANKKFSEFELKTTTSNVSHIVGYNGAENVRITPANFLDTTGGPYLPLAGGTMTGTNGVVFPDNFYLNLGTSSDFEIYHDGNNSYLKDQGTGELILASNGTGIKLEKTTGEKMIHALTDGAVELYYDSVKKFETTLLGATVTGDLLVTGTITGTGGSFLPLAGGLMVGNTTHNDNVKSIYGSPGNDLEIYHDGSDGYIKALTDDLILQSADDLFLYVEGGANGIISRGGSATELYFNNANKLATTNTGISVTGDGVFTSSITAAGGLFTAATETRGNIRTTFPSDNSYYSLFSNDGALNLDTYGVGGGMKFKIASSEKMTLSNAGNLGLGTSNPNLYNLGSTGKCLAINSISSSVGSLISLESAGAKRGYLFANDSNIVLSAVYTGASLNFNTEDTERMRLDASGNLGLGTSNPKSTFQIGSAYPGLLNLDTSNEPLVGSNFYYSAGDWKRVIGSNASGIRFRDGITTFRTSVWGAADSIISWIDGMTIASNGNLGIGTSTPAYKTSIKQEGDFNGSQVLLDLSLRDTVGGSYNAGTGSGISFSSSHWSQSTTEKIMGSIYGANSGGGSGANGYLSFRTRASDTVTERMRISSGGEVLIAATTYGDGANNISLQEGLIKIGSATTGTTISMYFTNPNGVVGSISTTGSATAFSTSSDYRLKEDLQDFKGLEMVSKIPVYDYKWKADESRSYGVMAHELQEVLPQAVTGEKDAEEMQSVDYSKIVPLLVKSIQELKAEIELLKNK